MRATVCLVGVDQVLVSRAVKQGLDVGRVGRADLEYPGVEGLFVDQLGLAGRLQFSVGLGVGRGVWAGGAGHLGSNTSVQPTCPLWFARSIHVMLAL